MPHLVHDDGTVSDLTSLEDGEFMVAGSASSCDIRIEGDGVARKHCRFLNVRGIYFVHAFSPKHPVAINGEDIETRDHVLENSASIRIGARSMSFRDSVPGGTDSPASAAEQVKAAGQDAKEQVKRKIHDILLERMDLKSIGASSRSDEEMKRRAKTVIKAIIDELEPEFKGIATKEELYKETVDEALGLGPLEDLIADDTITEIMCNGPKKVFVERKGLLSLTDKTFMDEAQLLHVIEKIVGPLGRRVDESSPLVDARLPDGSRVNAVIHPIALEGPTLNIRKFSKTPYTIKDIIGFGSMTERMGRCMALAVEQRQNIVISGGTGSGKTTLLNVVSSFIPASERIVTIEDSAELKLEQDHVVRLEARPPNIEGRGEISIRDLVRNALRMRPDRIVVGECRGGETLDMLQAMNTGHDGSLTTVHANSPQDVIARLETMVLMSGMDLPIRAIVEQIVAAIHLVCHQSRFSDGSRKIVNISEVMGLEGNDVKLRDIFLFRQTGLDANGKVLGSFEATGEVPRFAERLSDRGIAVDMNIFKKGAC